MLHWDDCLNHWMVDYDIICILKGYVGYSSWTDVPTKQRGLCYKNYNQNVTLPEWDIEQGRYWHFVTRDSAYSGWIHIKPIIKPIYRNIPFWNTSIMVDNSKDSFRWETIFSFFPEWNNLFILLFVFSIYSKLKLFILYVFCFNWCLTNNFFHSGITR